MGYAISFQRLLQFVTSLLPQSEVIEQALRKKRTVYPEIAPRENRRQRTHSPRFLDYQRCAAD